MQEKAKKKKKDSEMLIVHKPPQVEKSDRKNKGEKHLNLPKDVGLLVTQLENKNEHDRKKMILAIQKEWGNDFAQKVIAELEKRKNKTIDTNTDELVENPGDE